MVLKIAESALVSKVSESGDEYYFASGKMIKCVRRRL